MSVAEWNRLQLVEKQLKRVVQTVAEWRVRDGGDSADELCDRLDRIGVPIPILHCQGVTRDGDDCGLVLYHENECKAD